MKEIYKKLWLWTLILLIIGAGVLFKFQNDKNIPATINPNLAVSDYKNSVY